MRILEYKGNQVKLISLRECLKGKILAEVYQKSDRTRCLRFFDMLQKYLKDELSETEFNGYKQKEHFDIYRIDQDSIGGYYEISTNTIVILLNSAIINLLPTFTEEQRYKLADYFWTSFVHEDTHLQQQTKLNKARERKQLAPLKICNRYIKYNVDLSYDLDIPENVDYYSQFIEADAIAREIGEKLTIIYDLNSLESYDLHETVSGIFEDIKKDTLKDSDFSDEIQKIVNIYWDPRIPKKAKSKFFGTLYEYLYRKETVL